MKIQSYPNDNSISLQDKVTGTDAEDAKKTKNYTFQAIKDFFIAQGFGGSSSGASTETTPSYKVYSASMKQSGTSAPLANVLENTLGGVVVWSRSGSGTYSATLANAFTINKTWAVVTNSLFVEVASYRLDANIIRVVTSSDDVWNDGTIEIRVYN